MPFDAINAIKTLEENHLHASLHKTPNFDYMRIKNITFAVSATLAVIGLVALVQIARGQANLGVDFSGGSLLQYKARQDFSIGEVRKALTKNGMAEVDLQKVENEQRLDRQNQEDPSRWLPNMADKVGSILSAELPDKNFVLESESEIGSSVSSALRNKALMAIFISFAGVIVYLAFRFDIRFGVAAAVATFHDIFVVIGICWLMNMEFTLLIVTALLTLAGYSLNDTVVVFDRIRENTHRKPTNMSVTKPSMTVSIRSSAGPSSPV